MATKAYAQVYSLIRQDRSPGALYSALPKFSKMGYDGVETCGANTAGLSLPDFKKYLEDLNLELISAMTNGTPEEVEYVAYLGGKFNALNYNYKDMSRDEILRVCDDVNAKAETAKKAGLITLLHNHAHEFGAVTGGPEGITPYDLLLENLNPETVGMEFDVGWAQFAGFDPAEVVKKNSGRFYIIHVKECNRVAKDAEEMEHFPRKVLELGPPKIINGAPKFLPEQERLMYESRNFNVELGNGLIDWAALTAAAKGQGHPVYFVNEREYYHAYGANGNEEICAQKDCEFIHAL